MRKLLLVFLAVSSVVGATHAAEPFGAEDFKGTIVSTDTTSRNNQTTTAGTGVFVIKAGSAYTIVCDQDARYKLTDASGTAATAKSYPIPKSTGFIVIASRGANHTLLWTLSQGAGVTSNCDVYEKLE